MGKKIKEARDKIAKKKLDLRKVSILEKYNDENASSIAPSWMRNTSLFESNTIDPNHRRYSELSVEHKKWHLIKDEFDRTYWHNIVTGESSWEAPAIWGKMVP